MPFRVRAPTDGLTACLWPHETRPELKLYLRVTAYSTVTTALTRFSTVLVS